MSRQVFVFLGLLRTLGIVAQQAPNIKITPLAVRTGSPEGEKGWVTVVRVWNPHGNGKTQGWSEERPT